MFDRLSDGFSGVLRNLSGKGKISEANIREAMCITRDGLCSAEFVSFSFTRVELSEVLRVMDGTVTRTIKQTINVKRVSSINP